MSESRFYTFYSTTSVPGRPHSFRYIKQNHSVVRFLMALVDAKLRRPQVDTCSICEEKGAFLRSNNISEAEKQDIAAELIVHKLATNKFYNLFVKFSIAIYSSARYILDIFYYRQLWAKLYVYPEGIAKKSPNEIYIVFDLII